MKKKKPELVLLVFILILFAGLAIVSVVWRNNNLYTNAYENKIQRANEYQRSMDSEGSVEPRTTGLREREIEKQEGDRFRTY